MLIAALSLVSLVMIFLVAHTRYQSAMLAAIIMANIPWLSDRCGGDVAGRRRPVGRLDDRLYHARRHRDAQRHPEDQPLLNLQVRGRPSARR